MICWDLCWISKPDVKCMINANIPPNFANAVSPFSPVGKLAVGQENEETRNTPFKPVEESAETARSENRRGPDERPGEVDERTRLRTANQDGSDQELRDEGAVEERRQQAEQRQIRELAQRDREVRAHEQAHASVGGRFAGAPRFTFQRGPDGVNYAVGGEVSIDTSSIPGNPEATIAKAQLIRRAALSPADPSPQDRRVAAQATAIELEARSELSELEREQARIEQEEQETERAERIEEQEEQEKAEMEEREAQRQLEEQGRQNVDLNRRLADIGISLDNPLVTDAGSLLDQNV